MASSGFALIGESSNVSIDLYPLKLVCRGVVKGCVTRQLHDAEMDLSVTLEYSRAIS